MSDISVVGRTYRNTGAIEPYWKAVYIIEHAPHLQRVRAAIDRKLYGRITNDNTTERFVNMPWIYYVVAVGKSGGSIKRIYGAPHQLTSARGWLRQLPMPNLSEGDIPCFSFAMSGELTHAQQINEAIVQWWGGVFNTDYLGYQVKNIAYMKLLRRTVGGITADSLFRAWSKLTPKQVSKLRMHRKHRLSFYIDGLTHADIWNLESSND